MPSWKQGERRIRNEKLLHNICVLLLGDSTGEGQGRRADFWGGDLSTVKTKLENKTWLGGEKIETMARAESLMVKGKETVAGWVIAMSNKQARVRLCLSSHPDPAT